MIQTPKFDRLRLAALQGGPRQFDKRYNAGKTAGRSWTVRTRKALVSGDTITMRTGAGVLGVLGGYHVTASERVLGFGRGVCIAAGRGGNLPARK